MSRWRQLMVVLLAAAVFNPLCCCIAFALPAAEDERAGHACCGGAAPAPAGQDRDCGGTADCPHRGQALETAQPADFAPLVLPALPVGAAEATGSSFAVAAADALPRIPDATGPPGWRRPPAHVLHHSWLC